MMNIYILLTNTRGLNDSIPPVSLAFSRILYKERLTVKKGISITLVLIGILFLIATGIITTNHESK